MLEPSHGEPTSYIQQQQPHIRTHTGGGEDRDAGSSDIMFNKVNLTINLLKDNKVPRVDLGFFGKLGRKCLNDH